MTQGSIRFGAAEKREISNAIDDWLSGHASEGGTASGWSEAKPSAAYTRMLALAEKVRRW